MAKLPKRSFFSKSPNLASAVVRGQALLSPKGQALLIVLLVMAVVLTVILSVLSRSITDIGITTLDEDAVRAFSAAEAGIERALIVGSTSATLPNQASFNATVSDLGSGATEFVHPTEIYSGEMTTFWFTSHDSSANLICGANPCFTGSMMTVCWGDEGTPTDSAATPAIEVSVYYDTDQGGVTAGNFDSVRVARSTYDSNAGRRVSNNFYPYAGSCGTIAGKNLEFSSGVIDFADLLGIPCLGTEGCLLAATVRTLYNTGSQHPVGVMVDALTPLPPQGKAIASTGYSGEATRKVQVFQTFPELPFILNAAVFSPNDLTR